MMAIRIELDMRAINALRNVAFKSAVVAMNQLETDLNNSETMPFDRGDMQNNQTFVKAEDNTVRLVTGSPQARRLYYHPEYNFQQGKNANAGGKWLEPYLKGGEKENFVADKFAENFKREAKL